MTRLMRILKYFSLDVSLYIIASLLMSLITISATFADLFV